LSPRSKDNGRNEEKVREDKAVNISENVVHGIIENKSDVNISEDRAVDSQTFFEKTKDRFSAALRERYKYDSSIKRGQNFLLKHVGSKMPLVIIYTDIVESTTIVEFEVSAKLKEQGIKEIRKEGRTIVIIYIDIPIRFDIQKSWSKTIDGFESAAKHHIKNEELIQAVIICLNSNYPKIRGLNNIGNTIEQKENDNTLNEDQQKVVLEDLEHAILDKDYAEFVIKTAKRTVKQENSLVRQIFYSGISVYTNDPINLGIIAPTSEGKTYPVIEVMNFFPREDVWYIGSMSPKALIRQKGTLVDSNNEPLDPQIKELKRLIAEAEDTTEEEDLKDQLKILFENSKTLIDLTSKVIHFFFLPKKK